MDDTKNELNPGEVYAETVWAQLADKSDDFRESFIGQLREHMCTNCGDVPGSWCCYDSRPE